MSGVRWAHRLFVWIVIVSCAGLAAVAPRPVFAGPPKVQTTTTATDVEVGQRFSVALTITSDDPIGVSTAASLAAPLGVSVEGPAYSSSTTSRSIRGVRTTQSTVRVTFHLMASEPGRLRIPSPTVVVDGKTLSAQGVDVNVSPATGGLTTPPSVIPSPFDFDRIGDADEEESATAKELALPKGDSEVVFLRAIPDKERVYVGEQITYSVYLYFRVSYEMSERSDPKYTDFLRYPLLPDPGASTPVYTRVGGRRYGARLVERVALIPLRAGKLSIGTMAARFKGREIGARVQKLTNPVEIEVVEPPLAGRPVGYVVGDVGQFSLSAAVSPRKAKQGGSVGITVRIEGRGNVPTAVVQPKQKGVEWLAPLRRDAVSTTNGRVSGSRSLEYVVRLDYAGTLDLGTLELPYFDPESKRYEVAKVALGEVEVEEVAPTKSEIDRVAKVDPGSEDQLASLPAPRKKRSAFAPAKRLTIAPTLFAAGVALPPALALLILFLGRARRALVERRNRPSAEARARMKRALADARKADKKGDVRELSQAVERAVHHAIELASGVKSRGIRSGDLPSALVLAGVVPDAAEEAALVLDVCDTLRFAPSAESEEARGLVARAKKLTKKLDA